MVKKTLKIIAGIVLALALTACGNSESSTEIESKVEKVTETVAETVAEAATETDTKANGETVTDGEAVTEADNEAKSEMTTGDTKTLVVYFSATGTTKGVAEKIANVTGADLYEIVPAEPYSTEDLDWNDSQSRTSKEMNDGNVRSAIASVNPSLDGYDTIYIGYPIWWGEAPRIMSTYVESNNFDGKIMIPFCTSGSSGIGRSGDNLAKQAGSGTWLDGDRLAANISEGDIQSWIQGLQ